MVELTVTVDSETEMRTIGQRLAHLLEPGDTVLLDGPIGAGKSVLVRAVLRELGVTDHVPSPTFALAFSYPVGRMVVVHADAYRLDDPREYLDLALEESYADACILIEWGSKVAGVVSDGYLSILIEPTDLGEGRRLAISTTGETWAQRIDSLGVVP